ncbi:hypothetical protein DFH29DRAFT_876674 [Suillus ampliporus]|nr:hypothetical protein DFH29DRAFT_876674 [Suillus ampliporus]
MQHATSIITGLVTAAGTSASICALHFGPSGDAPLLDEGLLKSNDDSGWSDATMMNHQMLWVRDVTDDWTDFHTFGLLLPLATCYLVRPVSKKVQESDATELWLEKPRLDCDRKMPVMKDNISGNDESGKTTDCAQLQTQPAEGSTQVTRCGIDYLFGFLTDTTKTPS